jgi:hypothetical protein
LAVDTSFRFHVTQQIAFPRALVWTVWTFEKGHFIIASFFLGLAQCCSIREIVKRLGEVLRHPTPWIATV